MSGNVWEWCRTIWQEKAYPFQVQDEWSRGYVNRTHVRVLRGGSWDVSERDTRCARRYRDLPVERDDFVGFRIVVVSPITPPSAL
jgi:formylglycine-generating enzyme required for sulfatase activity